MQKKKIFFLILIVLGSIIGLFDVGYLSMLEWQGKNSSACDLGGLNCNAVLTSQYSKLFNIPLAYWGLAYYLVLFILIVVYLDFSAIGGKHQKIFQAIGLMLWVGFGVSSVLLYLQAFVLKAFCLYCLISEIAIVIMIIGYLVARHYFKEK
ncbi:MAG: hypothetical protein A2418_00155 [Candidatus Brennerbacteria bacterium RIFOXYC1_FULL_41_11]|uniref:Vitamin K epoxide reductase domain-containing protein n=1 Tax=Candidatus Brennerbacteria bacterium RIFOXYD1_FULL_41_16 TaxID=1797529 RepID=A0A1G1XJK6_9BACT|nr:MAG: hypothetical protein A2391_01615 [Candidatus Brennerbacteria bacterium RIFOXYB1_FULL_41_13]OGY39869.1 MAG: hypothetical protein A2418_00155 [Candidatus Brennerbacteria bacterium RIFOXYC1_FULL_41_11]OGY40273.1 MAG: hypothetical protein A2570_03280 [Candidatus Brennerbacteria bacterium RIFOXYD1_FULL_41_16]